ncbi:hypothetical protein RvY_00765-2 [Ramazzottius varieornatus]|uniref:Protein sleepless n=1 Tax=Ramazzottius varieornatus TaxID=947166 RepID=A0A1D1UDX5_RAMVA|nr:hypothetical protein RvY_00765-2 [Ramazzottius varieornatus]
MLTLPVLLLIVYAGCLPPQGCWAIECYICNSVSDADCSKPSKSYDCATWCTNQGGWLTTTTTTTSTTTPSTASISPSSSTSATAASSLAPTDGYSPVPVDPLMPCPDPSNYTRCRIVVQTLASNYYDDGESHERISRSCGWTDESNGRDKDVVTKVGTTKTMKRVVYTCRTDKCNGAGSSHPLKALIFCGLLFLIAPIQS